jgi:hypothetical protein
MARVFFWGLGIIGGLAGLVTIAVLNGSSPEQDEGKQFRTFVLQVR